MKLMRRYLAVPLVSLLVGCANPPKPPPQPIIRSPSLKGGCLLPLPKTIDVSRAGSIELIIKVSESGEATNTTVLKSSGQPDQDRAFQEAAMACSFQAASSYTPSTGTEAVAAEYQLRYSWPVGMQFVGLTRCFPPAYPIWARALREQATVYVDLRRLTPDAPFEYRVTRTKWFAEASLDAVRRCVEHPEAQVGIPIGKWARIPIVWRLDQ